MQPLSRRAFLKAGALGALTATTACPLHAEAPTRKRKPIPIGIQLYSVRRQCAKDLPGVLKGLADAGYEGVEFAGYHGRKAPALRKLLDDSGLQCCGTHTRLHTLEGDQLERTAAFHRTLGNRFLIVPGLPRQRTAQGWIDMAKRFNDIAARARPMGMRVGYHAHGGDFRRVEGKVPWELFFDNADPGVVMQIDTGNCMAGGGDPLAMLRKYPGRSLTIHLKEHGGPRGAPIGEGRVPWKEILEVCRTTGGTEWFVVEHETGRDPMASVRACLANLRRLLA
jgi:sugar phosphate isomerase/epimerase